MNTITYKFPVVAKTDGKSIVYTTLPGKPDSSVPRPLGPDTRPRVTQKAAVGKQDSYYTFNLLRERIGKNPPEALAEMRRIEIICSQFRKKLTAHMQNVPNVANLICMEYVADIFKTVRKSNLKSLAPLLNASVSFLTPESQKGIKDFIPKFLAQTQFDSLHDYFYDLRFAQKAQFENEFLHTMGTSAAEIYKRERALYPQADNLPIAWNGLSEQMRAHFVSLYTFTTMANAYGLRKTRWRPWPGTDITFLISRLTKKGPLLVLGQFGHSHYLDDPICVRAPFKDHVQNCEHHVYAWGPDALKPKERIFCDPILIIGASIIKGLGVIYFVDTSTTATNQVGNRRIYAMRYEFFIEQLSDTRGFADNYEGFFPWGYHSPKQLNVNSI